MNYILISFLSRLNIFNSFRDLAGGPYYQLGVIPLTHLIYYQIYRPTLALFINPAELSGGRSSTGRNFCCVNQRPYIDQNRLNFLPIFLPVAKILKGRSCTLLLKHVISVWSADLTKTIDSWVARQIFGWQNMFHSCRIDVYAEKGSSYSIEVPAFLMGW